MAFFDAKQKGSSTNKPIRREHVGWKTKATPRKGSSYKMKGKGPHNKASSAE